MYARLLPVIGRFDSGNFDEALLRNYLEQHIASIPAAASQFPTFIERLADGGVELAGGEARHWLQKRLPSTKEEITPLAVR